MKRSQLTPIPHSELLAGYKLAVDNALHLFDGSTELIAGAPSIALALAQIGLEEVGKAYLLLGAGSIGQANGSWQSFWKAWRNHERKAAAGFMFEWFNPVQLQVHAPDGKTLDGIPSRGSFLAEKNAGLYVDYDEPEGRFVGPREEVEAIEAASRLGSLFVLANTALYLYDLITRTDTPLRLIAVSGVVAHMDAQFTLQQDVHKLLDALAEESDSHRSLVAEMKATFPACWRAAPQAPQ